jgi:hypothetical protein
MEFSPYPGRAKDNGGILMVRPSRSDESVAVKLYYRDQSGVMRSIDNLFMTIRKDNPGVIVYTKLPGVVQKIELE